MSERWEGNDLDQLMRQLLHQQQVQQQLTLTLLQKLDAVAMPPTVTPEQALQHQINLKVLEKLESHGEPSPEQIALHRLTLKVLEKLDSPAPLVPAPSSQHQVTVTVEPSGTTPSVGSTGPKNTSMLASVLASSAAITFIGLAAYAILTYTLTRIAPTGVSVADFGSGYPGILERYPIEIAVIAAALFPLILFAYRKGLFYFWVIILIAVLSLPTHVPYGFGLDPNSTLAYEKVVSTRTDAIQSLQSLPDKLAATRHAIETGRRPEPIDFMGYQILDPGITIAKIKWTADPASSSAKSIDEFGSECVVLLGQGSDGTAAIYGPRKGLTARLSSETAEILRTNATSIDSC